MKKLTLFLFIALITFSSSLATQAKKPWTILVYLAADNDLEESGVDDLNEMVAAGAGSAFTIVVQADRSPEYDARPAGGIANWVGARRLVADKDGLKSVENLGSNFDSGDPKALADFIAWTVPRYPAEHYALVLWDHGGGWTGWATDETSGTGMQLAQIASALKDGLVRSKLTKFDFLGFDACLMACYEVALAMAPFSPYLLASEETEPGHGWDYSVLSKLQAAPKSGAVDIAGWLMDGFFAQAKKQGTEATCTLSLLDLGKLPALTASLEALAKSGASLSAAQKTALGRAAEKAIKYGKTGKAEEDTHLTDLASFIKAAAAAEPSLAKQTQVTQSALSAVVVKSRAGGPLAGSGGMSIYFPSRKKYYDAGYDGTGPSQWKSFLASYFAGGSAVQPAATPKPGDTPAPTPKPGTVPDAYEGPRFDPAEHPDGEALVEYLDGYYYVMGSFAEGTPAKVVEAYASYGIMLEDETIMFVGGKDAVIDDDYAIASWDGTHLVLRQDKVEAYGYLSESYSEDGFVCYSVPFAYYATGDTSAESFDYAWYDLTIDEEGNIVSEILYREDSRGNVGELKPRRGSKIVPLLAFWDGEEAAFTPMEEAAFDPLRLDALELDFEKLEPGTTIYFELTIADSAEGEDTVFASFATE